MTLRRAEASSAEARKRREYTSIVEESSRGDGAGAYRGRAGGFTDWLPGAAERRFAVSDACLRSFHSWGYSLVATPLIEPLDTVAAGLGAGRLNQLFRFMDSDGSLLALVAERTISVARVVATQMRDEPFPLRLCYSGPVLRNQPLLGARRRETLQAGCELIGAGELAADAECVALAADALASAGLRNVQVDVGHADFLPGLLEGAGLGQAVQHRVLSALAQRDLVSVEHALEDTPMEGAERSLLLRFPALRGGREILDVAGEGLSAPRPLRALAELAELWELLEAHGVAGTVHLDLGAVRDWDYYTGPIFELFSGNLGFPLGSGGRYDNLLRRFGLDAPATGFVLQIDRCYDALERAEPGWSEAGRVDGDALRVAYAAGCAREAIGAVRRIRAAGRAAICDPLPANARPGAQVRIEPDGASWSLNGAWHSGSLDEALAAVTSRSG